MKNKILLILIVGLTVAGLSSCTKETTLGLTSLTFYPDITMNGEPLLFIAQGEDYVDAGATATENGEPIEVETSSDVDTSTPGSYSVGYKATNTDGFSKTVSRSIVVYDGNLSNVDLSGDYTANVDRNGTESYSGNTVTLTPTGVSGVYYMSDWIAGFYADANGRGYGANYAFSGVIQINGNNEVVELEMTNPWGDPFDSVVGTYDPATGIIKYDAGWLEGTYVFVVDMSK